MSAWTAERGGSRYDDRGSDEPGLLGRLAARMEPEEGWISLFLVGIMAAAMAWSLADARWILGRDNLTGFVIWLAVAGALWGYFSARLDMSPWLAHLFGAAIGAFLIIEAVGAEMPNAEPGLVGWFNATAESVTQAYLDLTWRHQVSTTQYGHFCLLIGILVWGTAQAASYDIFGYHRAVTGVLLMAVLLVANMCLTYTDQFWDLVLFSAAALALLLQAHAAEERASWLRHRVWKGGDFKTPHLEGGLGFASLAICASLILTSVASSAPLASALSPFDPTFRDFASWVSGYLPVGGQSRINTGSDFAASVTIGTSFSSAPTEVFTVKLPDQARTSKWRVAAYDEFRTTGWAIGPQTKQITVGAGDALTAATADAVGSQTPGRIEFRYVVHVQDTSLRHMVVANEPDSVSVQVDRVAIGTYETDRAIVWYPTTAQDYTVTAFIPDPDPAGKGLTEWRLRHAGTQLPAELLTRYTQGVEFLGEDARSLLLEIRHEAAVQGYDMVPQTGRFANAYDAAKAIQEYLQDPDRFTYDSDIGDLARSCVGLSTVDCFAISRHGFCEQFATTMTMLMRLEGYPARYVVGFLPGRLEQHTLIEQVTAQQRHAWVEVYFLGYGWIPFDPTGGGVGSPTELPPGSAVEAIPAPSFSSDPNRTVRPGQTPYEPGERAGGAGGPLGGPSGPFGLLLPAVLAIVTLGAVILIWNRRPGRPQAPDSVYRGIVRLASRLGFRPKPTQTIYEYTGMLADIVPGVRDPLGVVAMAEVEVVYGKRQLSEERLSTLQAAERRVRGALLRLIFKLPGRRPAAPGQRRDRRGSTRR